jgi:prolyl 4-hydroxylase
MYDYYIIITMFKQIIKAGTSRKFSYSAFRNPFFNISNYTNQIKVEKNTHIQQIFTINNFFSNSECTQFIKYGKEMGFKEATVDTQLKRTNIDKLTDNTKIRKDIRNNDRLIFDNNKLANTIYAKLISLNFKEFIPDSNCFSAVNPRFKIYRYSEGQQFNRHVDGVFIHNNEESRYTMLIYLNDDFKGGETEFYGQSIYDKNITVIPKTGSALIFSHNCKHAGLPVLMGNKYVLRTDLMFNINEYVTIDAESGYNYDSVQKPKYSVIHV